MAAPEVVVGLIGVIVGAAATLAVPWISKRLAQRSERAQHLRKLLSYLRRDSQKVFESVSAAVNGEQSWSADAWGEPVLHEIQQASLLFAQVQNTSYRGRIRRLAGDGRAQLIVAFEHAADEYFDCLFSIGNDLAEGIRSRQLLTGETQLIFDRESRRHLGNSLRDLESARARLKDAILRIDRDADLAD